MPICAEVMRIDYLHTTVFFENPLNAVGATTSLTLRTGLAVPGANDAFVKKFGTVYGITDLLAGCAIAAPRSDGPGVNQWDYEIWASNATDGTVQLGRLRDALGVSAFLDLGTLTVPATSVSIFLVVNAGTTAAIVDGDTLTLNTDVDPAGLAVLIPAETLTFPGGITPWVYISSSGSTYYDVNMRHGGFRHTSVVGSSKFPYTDITLALVAAQGLGSILEILDSETYEPVDSGLLVSIGPFTVQSSLGQTPTVTRGIGARITREVSGPTGRRWHNNATTIYFNESGNDANSGTWHSPMLTATAAIAAATIALNVAYGGTGATVTGGRFIENITLPQLDRVMETEYGYTPTIEGTVTLGFPERFEGWQLLGDISSVGSAILLFDSTVDGPVAIASGPITVRSCEIRNAGFACINMSAPTAGHAIDIRFNKLHDAARGIAIGLGTGGVMSGAIAHNLIYRISDQDGIVFQRDFTGALTNNTFYLIGIAGTGIGNGIRNAQVAPLTANVLECIFHTCARFGIEGATGTVTGDFNTFFNNGSGDTFNYVNPGGNDQAVDPRLTDPTASRLGLSADSPCLNFDAVNKDTGPNLSIIVVSIDDSKIDGLILDGQNAWFNSILVDGSATNTTNWCTIEDTDGIGLDTWRASATSHIIQNILVRNCGSGIRFPQGSNTLRESVFHNSRRFNIHLDNPGNSVNHVTSFGGEHGLFTETLTGGLVVRDSIFSEASLFVVFAAGAISLLFCDADGTVGPTVDVSDASNLIVNALFVNINLGVEDFHIRTEEGGFRFESPCKDAASDGTDMGAYLMDRGTTDESWETFEFEFNPSELAEQRKEKRPVSFDNVRGESVRFALAQRKRFGITFGRSGATADDDTTNPQARWLNYLSSLIETDENNLTREQTQLRLHLRPTQFVFPGDGTVATGDVDASDATIFVAAGTLIPDDFKGYSATIRQTAQITNGIVDAVAETITSAAAGWTVNEWVGYWVRQNQWYFRVLSNTATVLTLSDPNDHLVSVASGFEFYIQSSHKVARNDEFFVYVDDTDNLLRDRTGAEFFIDFIVMRLTSSDIDFASPLGFAPGRHLSRIPRRLRFEESGLCP